MGSGHAPHRAAAPAPHRTVLKDRRLGGCPFCVRPGNRLKAGDAPYRGRRPAGYACGRSPAGFLPRLPERKGRGRQGRHRDRHEQGGVVVRRNPVGAQRAAGTAAVDDRPIPVLAHPHADGVHNPIAERCPVARTVVDVDARQTAGAVVAVPAPRVFRRNCRAADRAGEALVTGGVPVV